MQTCTEKKWINEFLLNEYIINTRWKFFNIKKTQYAHTYTNILLLKKRGDE